MNICFVHLYVTRVLWGSCMMYEWKMEVICEMKMVLSIMYQMPQCIKSSSVPQCQFADTANVYGLGVIEMSNGLNHLGRASKNNIQDKHKQFIFSFRDVISDVVFILIEFS